MRESQVEKYLRESIEKLGGKCIKLVAIGKDRGIPDRLLILPTGLNAYVELKAPGETSSKQQVHRQNELLKLHQHVFEVDSIEMVDKLLAWINAILTRKGYNSEREL